MVDGDPYTGVNPVLIAMQARTQALTAAVMALAPEAMTAGIEALRAIVGEMTGSAVIVPPFLMEYGVHIRMGDRVYINRGSVFPDSAWITLGDGPMVGPNVQFLTVGHPVRREDRFMETPGAPILPCRPIAFAKPIGRQDVLDRGWVHHLAGRHHRRWHDHRGRVGGDKVDPCAGSGSGRSGAGDPVGGCLRGGAGRSRDRCPSVREQNAT